MMNQKFYTLFFLLCIQSFYLQSQETYKIIPIDDEMIISELVEVSAPPSLLATTNPMVLIGSNYFYADGRSQGVILSEIDQRLTSVRGSRLIGQRTNLTAVEILSIGTEHLILGNLGSGGCYISKINAASQNVLWTKGIQTTLDSMNIEAVDLWYHNNKMYVIANIHRLAGNPEGFVVMQLNENGEMEWSKWYTGSAITSHYYLSTSITFSSDRRIIVTGRRENISSSIDSEIFLLKISETGELQIQKILNFFNAFAKRLRPKNPYLDVNGINIHLVMQAVERASDVGNLSVTMIDNDFNIRTWRNYSPKFQLEEFKLGSNKFMMSGQNPVGNGGVGYAMVGINNANAIPEIVDYYVDGFENSSIATSSSIAFHRTWQKYILAARSNQSDKPFISLAVRPENKVSNCADTFSFTVTKDPIDIVESLDVVAKDLSLETSNLNLFLDAFEQSIEVVCSLTSTDQPNLQLELFPTLAMDYLQLIMNPINLNFRILDLNGISVQSGITDSQNKIDIQKLIPGMYSIQVWNGSNGRYGISKFVKL